MTTRSIKIKICDHPDCDQWRTHSRAEPADGIHATVTDHGPGGGLAVPVYACTWDHLGEAARTAWGEAYDHPPETESEPTDAGPPPGPFAA